MIDVKNCTNCGQLRSLDNFYFISKKTGKRRGQCKDCMREIKAAQRDPSWTPSCSQCGRERERAGPGRRLCQECFSSKYDAEARRENGSHRENLRPCPSCGAKRLREDHVSGTSLCPVCRSVKQSRRTKLKRFFNLTPREFLQLLGAQAHVCAICRKKPRKPLAIDHRHSDGLVRGAVCNRCNTLLGLARDDPEVLVAAASYLECPPAQDMFPGRTANREANRYRPVRRSRL